MPTATPVRPSLTASQHAHHWVIGEPDGPMSVGHCRSCHEQRSFSNASPASTWTRDVEVRSDILGFRRQLARRPSAFQLSDEAVAPLASASDEAR